MLEKACLRHSTYLGRWNYKSTLAKLKSYLSTISGSSAYQPRFALRQILFSYIGSFFGIAALAYLSVQTKYPLIAAPFGAAAVLVFAVPDSPLAQPRNVVVGNFLAAVVSLVMVHLFGSEPWVMALAVATAIKVMQLTKNLHPPGGAVALVGVMSHAEWDFLITPVLAGSVVLVLCSVAFNNLVPGRPYPKHCCNYPTHVKKQKKHSSYLIFTILQLNRSSDFLVKLPPGTGIFRINATTTVNR